MDLRPVWLVPALAILVALLLGATAHLWNPYTRSLDQHHQPAVQSTTPTEESS